MGDVAMIAKCDWPPTRLELIGEIVENYRSVYCKKKRSVYCMYCVISSVPNMEYTSLSKMEFELIAAQHLYLLPAGCNSTTITAAYSLVSWCKDVPSPLAHWSLRERTRFLRPVPLVTRDTLPGERRRLRPILPVGGPCGAARYSINPSRLGVSDLLH